MAIEQKGLQGKEKEQFRDMLPPDDYEPDWKKQFKLMDRHTNARKTAERLLVFAAGFALSGFVPGAHAPKAAFLAMLLIWFAVSVVVAVRTQLAARAIDKKLDEDVRIEKEAAAAAAAANIEAKA